MSGGEIVAGITAFKTMLDIAKAMKGMSDTAARNAAVIELQEQILSAQMEQSSLIYRVRDLEAQMRDNEERSRKLERYELKDLGWGTLAYMLKPEARGAEPPHWVCTNCYNNGKVSIVQFMHVSGRGQRHTCPACKITIEPSDTATEFGFAKWLD